MVQERIQKEYPSIKLPEVFEEQDRGFFKCCEPMLVLAGNGAETWKNDVTSAWIKLSGQADTYNFILQKDGQLTNYQPVGVAFPNENDAFYCTINWEDVLAQDGIGCYELIVKYNISGIIAQFTWGIYKLLPYSIENALKTARIRVKFNFIHEIEGINFKGSNVEDSIRFFGFIGERQPNTEIDNLIYQDRSVKSVVRENLDTYTIFTDPYSDDVIRKFTDLYLLSEAELFLSDYNAHNHSYRILDIPAIVQESPEIEYYEFSRKAKLTCVVGDKRKNKRTYF